jgi:hypothetical protein
VLSEVSGCQVYAVEYHLAPEYRYPTQLDQYSAVIDWVQGPEGVKRGVNPNKVVGGGDSAGKLNCFAFSPFTSVNSLIIGGNMTAALSLRRRDEGLRNISAASPFCRRGLRST